MYEQDLSLLNLQWLYIYIYIYIYVCVCVCVCVCVYIYLRLRRFELSCSQLYVVSQKYMDKKSSLSHFIRLYICLLQILKS